MKPIFAFLFATILCLFFTELSAQDFNMPTTGTLDISDCVGTIYDSGGANGDYSNNENGVVVIDPPGDDLISITFVSFNLENSGGGCFDELFIYDGPDTDSPLFPGTPDAGWCWDLSDESGTDNLAGQTFLSTGDAITIQFSSDGSVIRSGFEITFGCIDVEAAPLPGLAVNPSVSCDGVVEFSNIGAVANIWDMEYNWDFGDGNTSTDANPVHTYTVEGTYDIGLEICNQFGCTDTTFVEGVVFDSQDASCFELTMPILDSETFTGCSATLFDTGGPDGDAVVNNDASYTIISDEPNSILVLEFIQLSVINSGNDFMTVYDGPDTNAPILASYEDGDDFPEDPVFTTGDAVTIQVQESDFFNVNYEILINCLNIEIAPEPIVGVENTVTCSGVANFSNVGIEAAAWDLEYNWDFGDGTTSTNPNPIHNYTTEGTYDVTLELCNQFGCGETTSIGAVTFDSQDASCFEFNMPVFDSQVVTSCNGTLYDSGGPDSIAVQGNDAITTIAPGGSNVISLDFVEFELSSLTGDVMTIYDGPDINSPIIDLFNWANPPTEPLISSGNSITIQFQGFAFFDANYEILINCIPIDSPPVAGIMSNPPLFTCDWNVEFLDVSNGGATSWTWDFGDGTTSMDENPNHIYTQEGTYEVSLIACNDFGCDETTIDYEFLLSDNPICEGTLMTINTEQNILECSGILYDSGGPDDPFTVGEQSTVVLGAPNSLGVSIAFTEFDVGNDFNNDVLNIYDGPDNNAPLIGSYTGTLLPQFGAMIQSTSSFMTLEFIGAPFTFQPGDGFTAYWNVQGGTELPVASFETENLNPAYGVPFQFTDLTTEIPSSWFWDFGDGSNAFEQNPEHTYTTPGANVVTLNASNCVGTDESIPTVLLVQAPPLILTDADDNNPEGWEFTFESGETLDSTFTISNFGGGDLHYEITGFENTFAGIVNVLAYDFEADFQPANAELIPNIEEIIDDNLIGVVFSKTNTTDASELEDLLKNNNIFIVSGQSGNDVNSEVMSDFAPILQDFVNEGGTVLFMASQNPEIMFNTGLMEGGFELSFNNDTIYNRNDFFNPNLEHNGQHPILEGVESTFTGQTACIGVEFVNADVQRLMEENDFDLISYREQGEGKVVYLGFNYFDYNQPMEEILINTILWGGISANSIQWLSANPVEGVIAPGASSGGEVTLTFNTVGAPAGNYTANLVIASNDPDNPEIVLPINITIEGTPDFGINTNNIDFENIIQFDSETQTVTITNTGTDYLYVTNILFPSGDYQASVSEFDLYPTVSQSVDITFNPSDVEVIEDAVIVIETNVGNFEILVDANVIGAPIPTVNPTPIEITVDYAGMGSTDLTLTNSGFGVLEYELESNLSSAGFVLEFTTALFTGGFSWQVVDGNNDIIVGDGPYFYTEGETTYTEEITGLNPCEDYTLFVIDTGFGSITDWSVSNSITGEVLGSGGPLNFNASITTELGSVSPEWISFDSPSGELPSPDSEQIVGLDFDPGCLLGGVYESMILVNSNDPLNPVLEVPVIMTVIGEPDITFMDFSPGDVLDFNSLLIGEVSSNEITIVNNGTENLIIDDFVFDNDQFSISPSEVDLAPGEETTLVLTFTPDEVAENTATLTIFSNAGEYEFTLNGIGQPAPIANVNPNAIVVTVASGGTASEEVTVFNNGEGNLEYNAFLSGGGAGFIFEFTTDNFPIELIWELTDSEGSVVAGMPQGSYANGNTLYVETVLGLNAAETYTLLIEDSFIGCDGALSAYAIYDAITGALIEEGDQVGQGDCQYFTELGSPSGDDILGLNSYSGLIAPANNEILTIEIDASDLTEGIYEFIWIVETNDPLNPILGLPVIVNVVNVIIAPESNFSSTIFSSCEGTYEFTDQSDNLPDTWLWNFGDGSSSTQQNIVHQYTESGTYTVSLTVSNEMGSDIYEEQVEVFVFDVDASLPNIAVTGEEVSFSIDNFESDWSVVWNFGDGSPVSSISNPSHTYTNSGEDNEIYTVTAEVSNPSIGPDCQIFLEQEITVYSTEPPPTSELTFQVQTEFIEVGGEGMFLVGSFNNFEPVPMQADGDNIYIATVTVEQGSTYTYVFANGSNTETLADDCGIDDGTGNNTRSIDVGVETDMIVDPVCYNLCQTCILDGIQEIPNAQLTIAPNPSRGVLNYELKMEQTSDLQLLITNVLGEVIYQDHLRNQANYQEQIDLTAYPNGLYMIRFTNNQQQLTQTFVLQR